jgi:hypothetical protein
VERRHFFVRDMVEDFKIKVPFVRTADNWADFFTKAQPAKTFFAMRKVIMNGMSLIKLSGYPLLGWSEVRFLLGSPSCSASLTALRGALLAPNPRTQCPCRMRDACPCSARACLDPLSLDCVGCCGSQ